MLLHVGAGSQSAVAQLKARADKAEAESAQLNACLCVQFLTSLIDIVCQNLIDQCLVTLA